MTVFWKKTLLLLCVVFSGAASAADVAPTATPAPSATPKAKASNPDAVVDLRQWTQMNSTLNARARGNLSDKELKKIHASQERIKKLEAKAKSDKKLTPEEFGELMDLQDKARNQIKGFRKSKGDGTKLTKGQIKKMGYESMKVCSEVCDADGSCKKVCRQNYGKDKDAIAESILSRGALMSDKAESQKPEVPANGAQKSQEQIDLENNMRRELSALRKLIDGGTLEGADLATAKDQVTQIEAWLKAATITPASE